MMAVVAFLLIVGLIVIGILTSIYLYSQGALNDDYEDYQSERLPKAMYGGPTKRIKTSDSVMGDYVRRVVLVALSIFGLLILLLVLLINSSH